MSGYNQANTATTLAQSSYDFANTVNTYAYSAYATANITTSIFTKTNSAFDTANTALVLAGQAVSYDNQADGAFTKANAAFDQANTATITAQAAFDKANTDNTFISIAAGTYGNATIVPVVTVAANGRISSISNTAISFTANTLVYVGTAPSTNKGASGDTKGMVYLANNYFYYCTSTYTTGSANIWSRIASSDAW